MDGERAMTTIEHNKQTVLRYFDLMSRNDVRGLEEIYDESMQLHVAGTTLTSGTYDKARLIELAGLVADVFPGGLTLSVTGMVAEGEKVAVEAVSHGIHASGTAYHPHSHFLSPLRDGPIVESRAYMDTEHVTDVICGGKRPAR
jgi:ketosteroid isomerase-like protein